MKKQLNYIISETLGHDQFSHYVLGHMHMAMSICCSCSKQYSPSLTNIYTTKSYLNLSSTNTHSSSIYSCTKVQDEALAISIAPELTREMEKLLEVKRSELRRKRRRKRRTSCDLESVENCKDEKCAFVDKKMGQSRFMTPKEEAKFSWYLKERARIEVVRTKVLIDMGQGGHELASNHWAKAAGISQHSLDRILCNGRESEEIIASSYKRLVISIASSYQGKGLSSRDLIQEGSIGLLRGAIKFNPEKGYKLSTYAYWWIRQAITKAIANKSRIIRLRGNLIASMPKICEANTVLSRQLQRFPTYDEIAEAVGMETSVVRLAIERNRAPISLDQAITSHGCMFLQDIIPGPDEITPEAMVKKDLMEPEIEKLLLTYLCDREAHVLRLHYGLYGNAPSSFEEIGKSLKLSRERVRQINSIALTKLQQTKGIDDLKYFV